MEEQRVVDTTITNSNSVSADLILAFIQRAASERVEITVTIDPTTTEIRISPYEPLKYVCPARFTEEEDKNDIPR